MGIATKKRRKITVKDREFIWYLSDDYDSADKILSVASTDKKFIVNYHLEQSNETCHLIILGKEFNGLPKTSGWTRIRCPKWEEDNIIKPSSVKRLIEWCFDGKPSWIKVDWIGNPL